MRYRPYVAILDGDDWSVSGDPHIGPEKVGSGAPRVDISASTGKVTSIGIEA
jgi:hypothetical protein